MTDEASLTALLEVVERDRATQCQAILESARDRAGEIVRAARRRALSDVRSAVKEARARKRAQLDEARAELVTEARLRRTATRWALISEARAALPGALRGRWEADEERREWIDAVADAAADLPRGEWIVEHPAGLERGWRAAVAAALGEVAGHPPVLEARASIDAGLRIRAGTACLDATSAGLMVDRAALEGRLLAEIRREVGGAEGAER